MVEHTAVSNPTTSDDVFRQKGNNYALFTHNIFKITDQLSLTLGARYTIDQEVAQRRPQQQQPVRRLSGNILRCSNCGRGGANPAGNGGLNPAIAASPTR